MKDLRLGRFLVPSRLESALLGASILTKGAGGWAPDVSDGLLIDLSETEFAELSAMAQVAVLVEGAARHRIPISIALPLTRPRAAEAAFISARELEATPEGRGLAAAVRRRVLRRQAALGFMQRVGFIDALKVAHVPTRAPVRQLNDYDHGFEAAETETVAGDPTSDGLTPAEEPADAADFTVQNILRFQWYAVPSEQELRDTSVRTANILSSPGFGLPRSDARAIATNVVYELIENVYRHADDAETEPLCRPHCLLAAIVFDANEYDLNVDHFRPPLQEFVSWARASGSPIVHLIVGDSGRGLPSSLGAYFKRNHEAEIPKPAEALSHVEKVLFWAFNRWSTSQPDSLAIKRGTRGLWRVRRFVRTFAGAVAIRATDSLAGWSHADLRGGRPLHASRLRLMPGTLLDVWLLPNPRPGTIQNRRALSTPDGNGNTEFHAISCRSSDQGMFKDSDWEAIAGRLALAGSGRPVCVVASLDLFPLEPQRAHQLLADALAISDEVVNHGALVLLCTGMKWRQFEPLVDSLTLDIDVRTEEPSWLTHSPVALIDAEGVGRWYGGSPHLRGLLNGEWGANGDGAREELSDLSPSAIGHLVDHPDVIRLDPDRATARFTLGDVNTFLIANVADRLRDAIARGSSGVFRGFYVTPTLELVNRWVDVPTLIDGVLDRGIVMYALARHLEASGVRDLTSTTTVIGVDIRQPDLTARLSEHLGLGPVRYSIPGELAAYDYPVAPRVPAGMNVVLFADLILTENTVRHAITDLARWGARPAMVVCILDGRRRKEPVIRCLGKQIPVVALAAIDVLVDLPAGTSPQTIDAVSGEPSDIVAPAPAAYDIPPETFLGWCRQEEGVIYLGHIERSVRRHFTTYLNPSRLIDRYGDVIVGHCIKHISMWLREHAQVGDLVEIWHPGPTGDFASHLATAVREALVRDAIYSVLPLRGIYRQPRAGRWSFPTDVPAVQSATHVVAIDWGSVTSSTVQQLMRLSASAGAESVCALVLLSQMPVEDETALRQVRSIAGRVRTTSTVSEQLSMWPSDENPPSTEGSRDIDSTVIFLSSLQLGFYSPHSCPVCTIRRRYAEEVAICPSDLLRNHARAMAELLKEREREDVFRTAQVDLFGAPVDPSMVASVVELRMMLEAAVTSTNMRSAVRDRLRAAAAGADLAERATWLRLLAAEPSRLKLPPLRFYELRRLVADIALSIAASNDIVHPGLRRQAIVVLRAASKKRFVDTLPRVLQASLASEELIADILYAVFSYLQRPYHDSESMLNDLHRQLTNCRDVLAAVPNESTRLEYKATLASLLRFTEFSLTLAGVGRLDTIEAWRLLQSRYREPMESHCDASSSIIDVCMTVGEPVDLGLFPDRRRWQTILDDWQNCQTFLAADVLPYVRLAGPILLGEYYSGVIAPDYLWRLREIVEREATRGLSRVTDLLYEFARDPGTFVKLQSKRDDAKRELEWWLSFFLDAGAGPETDSTHGAVLLRLLRRCPASLSKAFATAVEEAKAHLQFDLESIAIDEYSVFCDKELLRHAIRHLFENVAGPKHLVGPLRPRIRCMSEQRDERHIRLIILNDGTTLTPRGRGVETLNAQLAAFGASIHGEVAPEPWSYRATLSLQVW